MSKLVKVTGKEWNKGKKPYFIVKTPAEHEGLFVDAKSVFEEDGVFKTSEAAIEEAVENQKRYKSAKDQKGDQQASSTTSINLDPIKVIQEAILESLGKIETSVTQIVIQLEVLNGTKDKQSAEEDMDFAEDSEEEEFDYDEALDEMEAEEEAKEKAAKLKKAAAKAKKATKKTKVKM